jgi:2-haloacid dehalogenase
VTRVDTVIFDIGGVLVEWDPRRVYRTIFADEDAVERFLATVCTPEWNARMDAGTSFADAVEELTRDHPEHEAAIRAYHERWAEMLGGTIAGSVEILRELSDRRVPCYALSNWSAETFPIARERYADVLSRFDGILISADVGAVKPDPRVFEAFVERFGVEPSRSLFVDDAFANVEAARRAGFRAVRFITPEALRDELEDAGLL